MLSSTNADVSYSNAGGELLAMACSTIRRSA